MTLTSVEKSLGTSDIFAEISSYQPKKVEYPPKELDDFRKLSKYDRLRDSERFYKQAFIVEYLDDKWKIELYNRDSFYRLYELLKENPERQHEITVKLNQFKNTILNTNNPFIALMIDFRKYEYIGGEGVGYRTEREVTSGASATALNYQDVQDEVEWQD